MTVNHPMAEQTLLLNVGDKTKGVLVFFFISFSRCWGDGGGEGGILIYNIHFVFHIICNTSQQQTTQLCYWGRSEQSKHKHTMYTLMSCRQAHRHRLLWVYMFSLVQLLSTPSPLRPQGGPCHTVRQPQAREEHLPQDGREGLALPCPGTRETLRQKRREA